jgi:hypothetical protein
MFRNEVDPEQFDIEALAIETGVPVEDIDAEARLLKELKLLLGGVSFSFSGWTNDGFISSPPPERWDHLLRLRLSQEGLLWAASGFPDITMPGTTHLQVSVDVRIEVRNVIQQIREVRDVDEESKLRLEALVRRIEEELAKPNGEGSFKPVRDTLATANDTKSLLGPVIPFLANHWDKIMALKDYIPT